MSPHQKLQTMARTMPKITRMPPRPMPLLRVPATSLPAAVRDPCRGEVIPCLPRVKGHRPASLARQPADRRKAAAGLDPIGLHECRHTFASLMIAAGVNAKALASYMGHSSITITLDRYGHLMPGNEAEAVRLVDAYLAAEEA
jgi:integrase